MALAGTSRSKIVDGQKRGGVTHSSTPCQSEPKRDHECFVAPSAMRGHKFQHGT